ncbi:hypothetical protein DXX93_07760 [Thalassotalea euphylliae]|uniref:Uncharacterized protein n=1 Tax=Thalassotalea euphylliae TaxID=1655234 RepID=A0A3E0TPR0_9GAMM|nr:hypothetical protein [Thalassotalea euphylliae]REL26488.1 hypothetical protein DXX93_07760 [Thalassotalea euphylliae]
MKRLDFLLNVTQVPADLLAVCHQPKADLYGTYQLYQFLVDSPLLYKVWMVDEYGDYWLEVNLIDDSGEPAFHTIKIDQDSYEQVEFEPYQVLTEPGKSS